MNQFFRVLLCLCVGIGFTSQAKAQTVEWQQVMGGIQSEYLYDIKATPDYGFLLVGSSFSGKTGNKTESSQGNLDYFLWKMDELGHMEWQKSYGGSGSDYLYSASITKEGGYILGGSSDSPRSADKKEDGYGKLDFWILKLDPNGNEEWQTTLGGPGNDQLKSIKQTPDGGYIVGGTSDSPLIKDKNDKIIGNKTSENIGGHDYWVVKLNALGAIEWEKTYGGKFSDQLNDILVLEDGYLLGGNSNSQNDFGNKTSPNYGGSDYWVIKINSKGEEIWQRTYGGSANETLAKVLKTSEGYLLAGSSNSDISAEGGKTSTGSKGTNFWLIEIDENGEALWDETYEIGHSDILVSVNQTKEGEYLLGGYTSTQSRGLSKSVSDYVAIKINSKGEVLWQKTLGGDGNDHLKALVQMRDGGYLLAGNSNSNQSDDKERSAMGGMDYWLVKLGNENEKPLDRSLIEIYPNPTVQFTNVIITTEFKEASVDVFDMNGRKLQTKKLPYRTSVVDLHSYPPGVYIFKVKIDDKIQDVKVIKKGNK